VLHHRRPRFLGRVRVAHVEHAHARFALVADAQRNAGQPRDQRALERVRQHIGDIELLALELLGKHRAAAELQLAVGELGRQDARDLGHAREYRRHPLGRDGVDLHARVPRLDLREQRLRHQRVADPVGGNDEDLAHHRLADRTGSRVLRPR
jgi:hypothetical protein